MGKTKTEPQFFVRWTPRTGVGVGCVVGNRERMVKLIATLLTSGVNSFSFGLVTIHHTRTKAAIAQTKRRNKYPAM